MPQLDALRGIAALSVFWYHAFGMLPEKPELLMVLSRTPVAVFFHGKAAVILFFVMSGFVLNLKLASEKVQGPLWRFQFIVRRIFRIFPAFLFTTAVAIIIKTRFYESSSNSMFSGWFTSQWNYEFSFEQCLSMFTLVLPGINSDINPVVWSLVEEMRFSLLFPLLIYVTNRFRSKTASITILILSYCVGLAFSSVSIVRYLPHFILGLVCAVQFPVISNVLLNFTKKKSMLYIVAAIGIYSFGMMAGIWNFRDPSARFLLEQVVGLGAAAIILGCAVFQNGARFLNAPVFRFIGETSYSFYLLHMIFLFAFSSYFFSLSQSYVITWLAVLVISYFFAFVIFHAIEKPAIKIGNRIARFGQVSMSL